MTPNTLVIAGNLHGVRPLSDALELGFTESDCTDIEAVLRDLLTLYREELCVDGYRADVIKLAEWFLADHGRNPEGDEVIDVYPIADRVARQRYHEAIECGLVELDPAAGVAA